MSATSRREARQPFEVPVTLRGTGELKVVAACKDVSRSGFRVRVSLALLGASDVRFVEVLERVKETFGRGVQVEFRSAGMHGSRVFSKSAMIVRLAQGSEDGRTIDLGCLFSEPLGDEEMALLGASVGVPERLRRGGRDSVREELSFEAVSRAEADGRLKQAPRFVARGSSRDGTRVVGRHLVARPKQRHDAFMRSIAPGGDRIQGHTELLTPHAMLVRISGAGTKLGLPRDAQLTDVAEAFGRKFTEHVELALGPAGMPLWSGPVRVGGFEIPPDGSDAMLVTLVLDRPLEQAERVAMGLDVARA